MIFECVDCTFGGVMTMSVRGDKLEVKIVLAEGFLNGVGAITVKDVESGGCNVLL